MLHVASPKTFRPGGGWEGRTRGNLWHGDPMLWSVWSDPRVGSSLKKVCEAGLPLRRDDWTGTNVLGSWIHFIFTDLGPWNMEINYILAQIHAMERIILIVHCCTQQWNWSCGIHSPAGRGGSEASRFWAFAKTMRDQRASLILEWRWRRSCASMLARSIMRVESEVRVVALLRWPVLASSHQGQCAVAWAHLRIVGHC